MENEANDNIQYCHLDNSSEPARTTSSHANMLEYYGQWLLSIPRDDIPSLIQTTEYKSFIKAFQSLEHAHCQTTLQNQQKSYLDDSPASFLQHMALDDIVLRIFEFLPCSTLVRTSETCHRFHILSKRSAKQRTMHMEGNFYLESEMKLLRAKEQIEGIRPDHKPVVRVPLLGLQKRIFVTGSGDKEFNGIYFCTGSNGNGFLFTKPRHADVWTRQDLMEMEVDQDDDNADNVEGDLGEDDFPRIQQRGMLQQGAGDNREVNEEGDEMYPFLFQERSPRCIIAKRFSNETILWYMSKEIIDETGTVKQMFSFWAKLMVIGEATPDICCYPSQTSILSRNGEPAWQSLSSTRSTSPPIVELLD